MEGVALLGHTLHFSYSDCLEIDLNDFFAFIQKANEINKNREI